MIELYLIRHGESEVNARQEELPLERKINWGRTVWANLTPIGIEQSKALGKQLKNKGLVFDELVVSPSVRAIQTMRYCIEEMLGFDNLCKTLSKIEISPAMNEHYLGDFEGSLRNFSGYPNYSLLGTNNDIFVVNELLSWKAPGGESINEVITRTGAYVGRKICTWQDKKVAIFAHRGSITWLSVALSVSSVKEAYSLDMKNGFVRKLVYSDSIWRLEN